MKTMASESSDSEALFYSPRFWSRLFIGILWMPMATRLIQSEEMTLCIPGTSLIRTDDIQQYESVVVLIYRNTLENPWKLL